MPKRHATEIAISEADSLTMIQEYGVQWDDGSIERADDLEDAERLVKRYREWDGTVVSRVITIGRWEHGETNSVEREVR